MTKTCLHSILKLSNTIDKTQVFYKRLGDFVDVKIYPNKLSGILQAPSNKQAACFAFTASALSSSSTFIKARALPSFALAIINGLKFLNVSVRELDGTFMVSPFEKSEDPRVFLNVKNNASAVRFFLPIGACLYDNLEYESGDGLKKQSFADVLYALKGVGFTSERLPFTVRGNLEGGQYRLSGAEGANFISGLIIALATLKEDSSINFSGKLQGRAGIDACVEMLDCFSVRVEKTDNGYFIKGGQQFVSPKELELEGDYIASSCFLALKSLGHKLSIKGLKENSFQQDKRIVSLLDDIEKGKNVIEVKSRVELLPILCAVASLKQRTTEFVLEPIKDNVFLSIKECEQMLNKFGIMTEKTSNGIRVFGKNEIEGGVMVDCNKQASLIYGATVLALSAKNPTVLLDAGVINKHNPAFFNDVIKLGGKVEAL